MIEIDDKIVSLDLFTRKFCCDIAACKGECCVDGNSGAPLDKQEIELLKSEWESYKPYMKPEGLAVVEEQGFALIDEDGDWTTPLINDAECAYSIVENGITWCAIEKAWVEGKTPYRKPISCHLYPIRLKEFSNGTVGLQYHRWSICHAAETLGRKKGEPLFRTMREPLVRRFGEEFMVQLEEAYKLLQMQGFVDPDPITK